MGEKSHGQTPCFNSSEYSWVGTEEGGGQASETFF